jgi:hypothetical protein
MQAYKCHACPCAWAWEHFVRVALTSRCRPFPLSGRADLSGSAVRSDLLSPPVSLFPASPSMPEITRMRTCVITGRCYLGLQDAEKCVAWGVNARQASPFGSVRSFSCPGQGLRHHNPIAGVTGSKRWTSPLLWRRRHVDLTRRSRGPTVTRAFALQDYS